MEQRQPELANVAFGDTELIVKLFFVVFLVTLACSVVLNVKGGAFSTKEHETIMKAQVSANDLCGGFVLV